MKRLFHELSKLATLSLLIGLFPIQLLAQEGASDSEKEIARYREMMSDPFSNPGTLNVDRGERLWKTARGKNNATLEACDLGEGPGKASGAYAKLPRYFEDAGRVMDLEQRLLWCMENVGKGAYETAGKCEKLEGASTGLNWEWEDETLTGEVFELMFSSAKGLMETKSGTHIECTADTGNATTVKLVTGVQLFTGGDVTFTGCKELAFNSSCNTPGQASGVILSKNLIGELVYLKAAKTLPVGALLQPETGTEFTLISCVGGILEEEVSGSIIGEVTKPINEESTTGTLLISIVGGLQQWTKVEEGAAKFELRAFGEEAVLESAETVELLVGGVQLTFTIDA